MTPREPSEAAVEAALKEWNRRLGNEYRPSQRDREDMRDALRAAYAVDAANTAQSQKPVSGATEGGTMVARPGEGIYCTDTYDLFR